MSLKEDLNKKIKEKGEMTYNEVENYCKIWGHKPSYAERELRPSKSPEIESIKNKKGHIVSYRWIGKEYQKKLFT